MIKGKGLFRASGILMIVAGVLVSFFMAIMIIAMKELSASYGAVFEDINLKLTLFSVIAGFIGGLIEIAAGIFGLINVKKPEKAAICFIGGIIVTAVEVISFVVSLISRFYDYYLLIILVVVFSIAIPVFFIIAAIRFKAPTVKSVSDAKAFSKVKDTSKAKDSKKEIPAVEDIPEVEEENSESEDEESPAEEPVIYEVGDSEVVKVKMADTIR